MDVDETSNDNMDAVPASSRWSNLERFLSTRSSLSAPAYEENPANFGFLQERIKILVIGAGGLGCELLKDLGMMGFRNIDVIDMDTIDLSNLNRQFLFRTKDIGRPKAKVAAEFINRRIKGCNVVPHYSKIQDFDSEFYREFNVVVCGLDSVVARRWINGMLLSLVCYTDDGEVDKTSIIPLVDGGTEGFKGNARVVLPRKTACIECNIDLFPKQVSYPLCTIAETPRLPEHCVEYARIIQWPQQQPFGANVGIDGDDPAHIQWIYKRSLERARQYDIAGITYQLTHGVVKHIIPAVASTNAVIAAMCATEVWKVVTFCYTPMDNYTVFNDSEGVFTYTFQAERKEDCFACSQKPIQLKVDFNITLKELIELIKENDRLQLKEPSLTTFINGNNKTLYMSNIPSLEEATKGNLSLSLLELGLEDGCQLQITDSTSPQYILLKLISNNT